MAIMETDRLVIRPLTDADAPFIFKLMNDSGYIKNIGDRGINTLEDAQNYIRSGPMASYKEHGFGLDCVEERASGVKVGTCGLLKRPFLSHADVGYAFLPQFRSKGYARESVRAVVTYARERLKLQQVSAIVNPDNDPSIRLLSDLGFLHEKMIHMPDTNKEVRLYSCDLSSGGGNS